MTAGVQADKLQIQELSGDTGMEIGVCCTCNASRMQRRASMAVISGRAESWIATSLELALIACHRHWQRITCTHASKQDSPVKQALQRAKPVMHWFSWQ